jgi:transposase-like protein
MDGGFYVESGDTGDKPQKDALSALSEREALRSELIVQLQAENRRLREERDILRDCIVAYANELSRLREALEGIANMSEIARAALATEASDD